MAEKLQIVEVKYADNVELTLDGSVFKLNLDENGLLHCPKSLKKKLPPDLPERLEKTMRRTRRNGDKAQAAIYFYVEHEISCAEFMRIGACNCNPVFRYPTVGEVLEILQREESHG